MVFSFVDGAGKSCVACFQDLKNKKSATELAAIFGSAADKLLLLCARMFYLHTNTPSNLYPVLSQGLTKLCKEKQSGDVLLWEEYPMAFAKAAFARNAHQQEMRCIQDGINIIAAQYGVEIKQIGSHRDYRFIIVPEGEGDWKRLGQITCK